MNLHLQVPLDPHVHVVGSITAAPAQPLQAPFSDIYEAAGETGVVYVSLGTTAIPGMPPKAK